MAQVTPGGSLSLPWSICPLLSPAWPSLLAKVSPESPYVHLIIEVYIQGLRGGWIIRAEELGCKRDSRELPCPFYHKMI